jgi:hypothetical protein
MAGSSTSRLVVARGNLVQGCLRYAIAAYRREPAPAAPPRTRDQNVARTNYQGPRRALPEGENSWR